MWVFIKEHLSIHTLLHFSSGQALPTCLFLGGKGFTSLVPIPQLQQTVITKETTKISYYLLPLALNWPYPLITGTTQNEQLQILLQRPQLIGRGLSITLGVPGHLSIAESVSCCLCNPFGAFLPHHPEGLGDVEKFHSDVAFLVVLTEEGTVRDRVYGLSMIWVNPYRPGYLPWRKWSNNWLPWSPLDLIGLMPWCGLKGMPITCHSLERGI